MLCNGYDKVLELADGDLVELDEARGTTLRVTKGALWITQENDKDDIVLRAGDVYPGPLPGASAELQTCLEATDTSPVQIVDYSG